MSDWVDAILIGVVARTQGNRGEVIVNSETDFPTCSTSRDFRIICYRWSIAFTANRRRVVHRMRA